MFTYIILTCQQNFKEERSTTAIFYLLQGKQSIQTIQDASLFQLKKFYSIYPSLTKNEFDEQINKLVAESLLVKTSENNYSLTKQGEKFLEINQQTKIYLRGFDYKKIDELFLMRMLLMIQVWTNGNKKNNKYIPIIEHPDVAIWVKQFYQQTKSTIQSFLQVLYTEFVNLLKQLPESVSELFINQFTTYGKIGLTRDQLATQFNLSKNDVYLINMNTVHFIMSEIEQSPEQYPLLKEFTKGLIKIDSNESLTQTAKITYRYFNQGMDVNRIAAKRRLKINTIYDHLVEIALADHTFSIDHFVNETEQVAIRQAIQQVTSYRLKDIKEKLSNNHINYFQIRLVLAQMNREE